MTAPGRWTSEQEIWLKAAASALMAHAPLAVGVFDAQLRHVMVNDRLAVMNGLPAEQMLGRTFTDLHGPAVADAEAVYQQVLTSRVPIAGERFSAALPCEPDFVRHWELTCVPLPDDGPAGVIVLVDEVTHRVLAETQRDRAIEALREQARHDPLTGLLNRLGLQQWWADRAGHCTPVEVVYADLDGFKAVNDAAGHLVGDEVLTQIAQAMEAVIYDDEILVRVGGDEFVGISPAEGADLARRLTAAVDAVAEDDRRIGRITVSCGVGYLMPDEELDVGLQRADAAMYRAKGARS